MPCNQTATHPTGLVINFDEDSHRYRDENGVDYTSVTTFTHKYFPVFDTVAHSKRVAERDNKTPEQVRAEWDQAGVYGTKCHEFAEQLLKFGNTNGFTPKNEMEACAFAAIIKAVDNLLSQGFVLAETEKILFSIPYRIAGTADLLMWKDGALCILDWKTNKGIYTKGFGGGTGLGCLKHLPDCNGTQYSIQLAMYERIIRAEGYVAPGTKINRALIHIPHYSTEPVWLPQPCRRMETAEMLLDLMTPPF
jgi:ATP-dependent exoDNAse (exonuclease V) beta subunit